MPDMPKPSELHRRLQRLAGDWEGNETIAPSAWGPGGAAIGRYSARMAADGFWLLQDYTEEKDGRLVFQGHGVFGYDTQQGTYVRYWFDSMGFPPSEPARGQWQGDTLELAITSPHGRGRYVYRFEGDGLFHFHIDNSFDGGASWARLVEGTYRRR